MKPLSIPSTALSTLDNRDLSLFDPKQSPNWTSPRRDSFECKKKYEGLQILLFVNDTEKVSA